MFHYSTHIDNSINQILNKLVLENIILMLFQSNTIQFKNTSIKSFLICLLFALQNCTLELPEDVSQAYSDLDQTIDFNLHVKPILSDKCFQCHGPDKAKQKAGLRLDIAESAYNELPDSPGKQAIKPGNLRKSEG